MERDRRRRGRRQVEVTGREEALHGRGYGRRQLYGQTAGECSSVWWYARGIAGRCVSFGACRMSQGPTSTATRNGVWCYCGRAGLRLGAGEVGGVSLVVLYGRGIDWRVDCCVEVVHTANSGDEDQPIRPRTDREWFYRRRTRGDNDPQLGRVYEQD